MLISFAIHPEKAPKPLNRKSAAAANIHNLNILERDPGGAGGIPESAIDGAAAPTAMQSNMLFCGGSTAVPAGDMVRTCGCDEWTNAFAGKGGND